MVEIEYGGGIKTLVGASSVAVPGTLAALHKASELYGKLPWRDLLQPTIRAVRNGFPFARACHYYLGYAGKVIYGRSDDGYRALHDENGRLRDVDNTILIPHLADSLTAIADEGERIFYEGEIGRRIVAHVAERGGTLTIDDLKNYVPDIRDSLVVTVGSWQIATNPPPAIGGAGLAAMLLSFGTEPMEAWDHASVLRLIRTQQAVMSYRQENIYTADDITAPVEEILELAKSQTLLSRWSSGSTVHTSSVDRNGLAFPITASSGYGSGEMPGNTGIWLNNCLGEIELNRSGLLAGPPGKRLPSNMAPSALRRENCVLAIGSPGADRITTALHQFLVNFVQLDLDLNDAVTHSRMHLKIDDASSNLAVEPGIDLPDIEFQITRYPEPNMYFGGVVAALADTSGKFQAAADPRREGGTYIGPNGH